MPSSHNNEDPPFKKFGGMLRDYRDSYGERVRDRIPQAPARLTATALIEALDRRWEYHITSGAYSEVEQGLYLPRELDKFIDSVTDCLGIQKNSIEYQRLIQQLAYDVVSWRAGSDIAEATVPLLLNKAQRQALNGGPPQTKPNAEGSHSSTRGIQNAGR